VLNRLSDQLYFKVSDELTKNYINIDVNEAFIDKIKERVNNSLNIYKNIQNKYANKSNAEVSKVLRDIVLNKGFEVIRKDMDTQVDKIYENNNIINDKGVK